MKKQFLTTVALSIYTMVITLVTVLVYMQSDPLIQMNLFGLLTFSSIIILSAFALVKLYKENEVGYLKPKTIYNILFIIYIIISINMLFFSDNYRYNMTLIFLKSGKSITSYLSNSFNIVPFTSLFRFNSISELFEYVIGNLFLFVPFVFYIKTFINKKISLKLIGKISLGLILIFEGLQLLLLTGNFNIDDILLNFAGVALFTYVYDRTALSKIDLK